MSTEALQEKFGKAIEPVDTSELYCLKQARRTCEGITQWVLKSFEIGTHKYDVNFELLNNKL